MSTIKRIAAVTGVLSPVIAYGGIFVATILYSGFSWTGQALSHTGAVGTSEYAAEAATSAPVFNTALIVAGILALPYVGRLWLGAGHPAQKVGIACFGLSAVSLSMVGVAPVGSSLSALHTPAALGHYLMFSFGLWFYGTGTVALGRQPWGLTSIWLGNVHLLMWIFWAVGLTLGSPITGLAVPEFLGALIFGGWLVGTALRYLGVGPFLFD